MNMSEHIDKYCTLGVDIGGTHISAGLVLSETNELVKETVKNNRVEANADKDSILNEWISVIQDSIESLKDYKLSAIGIAMPGPFDYKNGICLMQGVHKYNRLYGLNIKEILKARLQLNNVPVLFENDAACFALGESLNNDENVHKIIAVTLGTGFGAAFIQDNKIVKEGSNVPPNGELYNVPYLDGICEDYVSARWILGNYNRRAQNKANSVYEIAQKAINRNETLAKKMFHEFAKHLASCITKWILSFEADCLIIGGGIAKSSSLFVPALKEQLKQSNALISIKISESMELSSIKGAASLVSNFHSNANIQSKCWRKSLQPIIPLHKINTTKLGEYNIYPSFNIGENKIFTSYDSLAEWMMTKDYVMIDGIAGNDWNAIQTQLSNYFKKKNVSVSWYYTDAFKRSTEEIEILIKPFISEPGDVWGKRTDLNLSDFYNTDALSQFKPSEKTELHILIGCGAAFANWQNLVYVDLPKNEIQYRMRAGQQVSISNTQTFSNPEIYKRLYFVDWIISNKHRESIYKKINVVADGQWRGTISWAFADAIFDGLKELSKNPIRVRPWFEAGAWGGQWMKHHIKNLNQQEINYAWSFELIVPENGIVLESDGNHLEVAFDWLMEREGENILGEDYKTFGKEFPIRFDFLDTVDGGNLSIQCHPSLDYIRNEFGETITQDETYYILDCEEDAHVYLGFQDDINPGKFRNVLEESVEKNVPVNITDFVQVHDSKKHDLFLIPNKTIHSSGKNNLVLEISATPYIFTFKMYDWLRLDLEGNPRPINIDHAFKNLDFSRKGDTVKNELISKPSVIEQKDDYTLEHLPTHKEHFYDVHRITFSSYISMKTHNKCFVMMLVEGTSILVKTANEKTVRFNYAETFVIPAAAEKFELINETNKPVKIIKAFIK
jgi:predicted NBD/HSP70 family sugar kinase/mannose-6-phosphate isomerase class I